MRIISSLINFFGIKFTDTNDIRESSVIRYNNVHDIYERICNELGDLRHEVSRKYIYNRIKDETGLSHKTIGRILNHTKKVDPDF